MGETIKLETYRPKLKVMVSKEEAVPIMMRIGNYFSTLGGIISFALSGAIMGVKSFFDVKHKIYNSRLFSNGRYVELKIKREIQQVKKRQDGK